MRKWLFAAFFIVAIPLGYLLRGALGREKVFWLIAGLLGLILVLKLVQLGLNHYVKVQEARMSPAERQDFEDFKRQHSHSDKSE
jgi:hypothetical protein